MSIGSKIKAAGASVGTFALGAAGLVASLMREPDTPSGLGDPSQWWHWVSRPRGVVALASAALAGLGAYRTVKQFVTPKAATEATAGRIEADLKEIKREVVGELDLVVGYSELPAEYVRRLPTALVVADYGVVPYDDALGSKAGLLAWAASGRPTPSGRLLVAPAGYGKTRLALELVTELRGRGWKAGLLPRAAFGRTGPRGEADIDRQLARFFQARGEAGALLVLDYAETRAADIERVTKAAQQAQAGGPVRLLLLARGAGDWWKELRADSRSVQLVFEAEPLTGHAADVPAADRERFFKTAASAFYLKLKAAGADDVLPATTWAERPAPAARLAALGDASPLLLAFEAFLHVRGVGGEGSVLTEMAREERRHWARALRLPAGDAGAGRDNRVEAVQRCASALTLIQGTRARPYADTFKALDDLVLVALRRGPLLGITELERANALAAVKAGVERLYLVHGHEGARLMPVLPDLLGEHVCAEVLARDPELLTRLSELGERQRLVPFVVANRIAFSQHEARSRNAARRALLKAIPAQPDDVLPALLDIGRYEYGGLLPAFEEAVASLPDATLSRLILSLAPNDPLLQGLIDRVVGEQMTRHVERGESAGDSPARPPVPYPDDVGLGGRVFVRLKESGPELRTAQLLFNAAQRCGDYEQASEWFGRAYELLSAAARGNDSVRFMMALNGVHHAKAAHGHGAVAEAERLLVRAAEDIAAIPEADADAATTVRLMYAATASNFLMRNSEQGYDIAWKICADALDRFARAPREAQDACTEPALQTLINATNIARHLGDVRSAVAMGEWALELANRYAEAEVGFIGSATPYVVNLCVNLSMVYTELGDAERAMQLSERAVELARELAGFDPEEYGFSLGKALDGLAVDYMLRGDFRKAVTLEEEAVTLLETSARAGGAEDLASALINQSSSLMQLGSTNRAKERLAQAAAIYAKIEADGVVRFPWMLTNLRVLEGRLNGH